MNDKYIEENNFIRLNKVEQSIYRLFVWQPTEYFKFIDYVRGSKWNGQPLKYKEMSSYDSGKNYELETGHLLYSANFYKSNEVVYHSFKA